MNVDKLKGKIVERGLNVEKIADQMGMHSSSLYRKLNTFDKITIGEADKIAKILNLSNAEAVEIFLH